MTSDHKPRVLNSSTVDSLELVSMKAYALNCEPSEVLVLYCADPRFRSAFQEFIRIELGVDHHMLLSVAGGVGPFVFFKPDSIQAAQMVEQLRLIVLNGRIKEIVVLNHSDCKWYSRRMPDCDSTKIKNRQVSDLQQFTRMIRQEIAEVSVNTYFAVLDEDEVRFKKVSS